MAAGGRSFSDVFQDIVDNVEDIVRSEAALAKSELLVEVSKLKAIVPLLILGGAAILLAALFLNWTIVYALALVLPMWAATSIVTALLATVGILTLMAARKKLQQVNPPRRTIANIKEDVQWVKQQAK